MCRVSSERREYVPIGFLTAETKVTNLVQIIPETMPPDLLKAHRHLDALVDKAYGRKFANDAERVAHLFDLYARRR